MNDMTVTLTLQINIHLLIFGVVENFVHVLASLIRGGDVN